MLADDMGLGKTVQALAHLAVEQAHGRTELPSLVICPTSLVPNWVAEAARFAPGLRCLVLHGPARAERFGSIGAHDLVVTTGTIEEKMEALKQRKQALADGILGASGGTALTLTEGDLDVLFAPLG